MKTLGIESSCDETSIAIIESNKRIIFDSVFSQDHSCYGGVYPEFASREHLRIFPRLVAELSAKVSLADLDCIAFTCGPGLIGSLVVGTMFANGLAYALEKPLLPINHLEGHILSARLTNNIDFPFLSILISGGHSKIFFVKNIGHYKEIGSTVDDAFGEAFDKVAKMLGLGYPGGKHIEEKAKHGKGSKFNFPRAMISSGDCNFSLSGIKTSVRRQIEKIKNLTDNDIAEISSSFQECICDVLIEKISRAQQISGCKSIAVVGGVASNLYIRGKIKDLCDKKKLKAFFPPQRFCTDNAAMIAWAAIERIESKVDNLKLNYKIEPNPKLGL